MVHDANTNLVKELRVLSDADDSAIQEVLMKLFNAQVQDQSESVAVEGLASRAKRSVEDQALKAQSSDSDQALKASDSARDQFSPDQSKSETMPSRSVQFNSNVLVSSSDQFSQCTLVVGKSSIEFDNSLRENIHCLLQKEILYKEIFEEMECTRKNELIWGQEKYKIEKNLLMIHVTRQPKDVQY